MARTDWAYDEIVRESDMNQLGQQVNENTEALSDIQDEISNLGQYKATTSLEILDIKLQLEEANVLDFVNKTGVGFYDLFNSTEYVDTAKTTATVDTVNKVVKFGTPSPSPAQAVVTFTENPGNGDTLTIGDITYTFKDTVSVAYDVAIGPDPSATVSNLTKAIMLTGTVGVNYGTGTLINDKVVVI